MHTQLVTSAGSRHEFKSRDWHRCVFGRYGKGFLKIAQRAATRNGVHRLAWRAAFVINNVQWRILKVFAKRKVDFATVVRKMTFDKGVVRLFGFAVLKLAA